LLVKTERDEGDRVRLSVKDEGVGFTPQAVDRLFEAFFTTKSDGMGIGLSISRSIIEAHRGRLWATANEGPGATFAFSIPCSRESLADAETRVNWTDSLTGRA
jgi:signal transduction histidine kinase